MQGVTTGVLPHERRVLSCKPFGKHTLISGCEGGSMHVWDTRKVSQPLASCQSAHAARIRSLCTDLSDIQLQGQAPESVNTRGQGLFATASSDGFVKLWDMEAVCRAGGNEDPKPVAAVDAKARFTCMCAVRASGRRSRGVESEAGESPRLTKKSKTIPRAPR